MTELDDYNFDKSVLENSKVSLVDFWAPWCGPCKMLSPVIEEVASEMGEKVFIAKMNVDDNMIVPGKYKIMSIPTLLIFKDGKIIDQMIGLQSKETITKRLESALK